MKLHELGAQRPTKQAERIIENQAGRRIDFSVLSPRRAHIMLQQVRGLLKEHRSSPSFHTSQQNPAYLQLVVMEQALQSRIAEQQPIPTSTTTTTATSTSPVTNDPKAKTVMDKVKRGQSLTPDEQKTVNKIAITKETKKSPRMVREQSELQQAQVVLAAQDMIDRLQGMLEDISEMQFKDLPALANSIKNDMGVEQATQFQTSASTALSQLLQAVQAGKTEMESAQGILTGQAPQVPGMEPGLDAGVDTMAGAAPAADGEELDLDLDANLPADEEEPEAGAVALGRERR